MGYTLQDPERLDGPKVETGSVEVVAVGEAGPFVVSVHTPEGLARTVAEHHQNGRAYSCGNLLVVPELTRAAVEAALDDDPDLEW